MDAPFAALSAAFLLFFAWALWRTPDRASGLGLIAANAAIYYSASYMLLNPEHHQYMGLLALMIGGVHLMLARNFEARSKGRNLTLGIALAFVTLAVPIQFERIPRHHCLGARRSRPGVAIGPIPELLAACRLLERADPGDLAPDASGCVPVLAELGILDVAEHAFPDVRRIGHGTLALGEISRASSSSPCLKNTFR